MGLDDIPFDILEKYEIHEWKHAIAILKNDFPNEWNDLLAMLRAFVLYKSWILAPGDSAGGSESGCFFHLLLGVGELIGGEEASADNHLAGFALRAGGRKCGFNHKLVGKSLRSGVFENVGESFCADVFIRSRRDADGYGNFLFRFSGFHDFHGVENSVEVFVRCVEEVMRLLGVGLSAEILFIAFGKHVVFKRVLELHVFVALVGGFHAPGALDAVVLNGLSAAGSHHHRNRTHDRLLRHQIQRA